MSTHIMHVPALSVIPKIVAAVTGTSAAITVQVVQSVPAVQRSSVMTEWTILSVIVVAAVSWGVTWGVMRARVSASIERQKEQKTDTDKVAEQLKADTDRVAEQLRVSNSEVAVQFEKHSTNLRGEIQAQHDLLDGKLERHMKEFREMVDGLRKEMSVMTSGLHTEMTTMVGTVERSNVELLLHVRKTVLEHATACPGALVQAPKKRPRR